MGYGTDGVYCAGNWMELVYYFWLQTPVNSGGANKMEALFFGDASLTCVKESITAGLTNVSLHSRGMEGYVSWIWKFASALWCGSIYKDLIRKLGWDTVGSNNSVTPNNANNSIFCDSFFSVAFMVRRYEMTPAEKFTYEQL